MQVTFTTRGQGWKERGRPRSPVPAEILDVLRTTHAQSVQAEVPLYGVTEADVRAFVRILTRGARQLGLRLRQQSDGQVLRFYAEDRAS